MYQGTLELKNNALCAPIMYFIFSGFTEELNSILTVNFYEIFFFNNNYYVILIKIYKNTLFKVMWCNM